MKKLSDIEKIFYDIIKELNKQNRQGTKILVDCGKLGYILVYWGNKWEYEHFPGALKAKEIK